MHPTQDCYTIRLSQYFILLLALLIAAALRVPGWFTEEEMARWRLFEVDEEQHVGITMQRYNELVGEGKTIRHRFHEPPYNVRGYGYLNASIAYVIYLGATSPPDFRDIVLLGRQISTFFALVLVAIIFFLGRASGLSPPYAGVAALLMACCDVNATYSHYMLPAAGYVMFAWMALLGGVKLLRSPGWLGLGLLALGAAGAAAFKFDVFPIIWGGLLLIILSIRGIKPALESHVGLPGYFLPFGILLLLGFLWIFTIGWSWEEIETSFKTLRKVNRDVIRRDDHFRDTLIAYPMGVLAG
ncbi:MAG: hypothetical protein AAF840_13430, partial [Bacteroidota bacterium]